MAALFVGIIALGKWEERHRSRAYDVYCRQRSYEYTTSLADKERPLDATRGLFEEDDHPEWGPAIRGTCNGVTFTAFECHWYRNATSRHHNDAIAAIRWDMDRTLPRFLMTPGRGIWTGDSMMRANYDGAIVEFDDVPEFSRHYSVQGNDATAVRALFTRDLRQALAVHSRHYVAGSGKELIWWRRETLPPAQALDHYLSEGDSIRALFSRP